jgi:hypothetical protein
MAGLGGGPSPNYLEPSLLAQRELLLNVALEHNMVREYSLTVMQNILLTGSVADPDPYVFGPQGSGSVSSWAVPRPTIYLEPSLLAQRELLLNVALDHNMVRLDALSLRVYSLTVMQNIVRYLLAVLRIRIRTLSGSVSQRYGSGFRILPSSSKK